MSFAMHSMVRYAIVGLCLAGFVLALFNLGPDEAEATPAFARKYEVSCNLCHTAGFPKLNDFGNRFRDDGYRIGDKEDEPTNLHFAYWPFSIRTTVGHQYSSRNKLATAAGGEVGSTTSSFGFRALDMQAFGTLSKRISFGLEVALGLAQGGFNTGAGTTDLEAAFIRFNDLFDTTLLNAKVGKYEMDLPFSPKRSPTINTSFAIYNYTSGTPFSRVIGNPGTFGTAGAQPGYGNANTTGFGDSRLGFELFGWKDVEFVDGVFRYALNVISNSDSNVAGTGGGRNLQFFGHVTQSFGGYGIVDGHRIGVFGMWGQAPTVPNAAVGGGTQTGTGEKSESFTRVGVDVSTTAFSILNVYGTYMIANDSRGLFVGQAGVTTPQAARWHGGFVEADYTILDPLIASYRFDWILNTAQGDATRAKAFGDLAAHTVAVRYYAVVNKRVEAVLFSEYSNTVTQKTGAAGGDQTEHVWINGVDFAF